MKEIDPETLAIVRNPPEDIGRPKRKRVHWLPRDPTPEEIEDLVKRVNAG